MKQGILISFILGNAKIAGMVQDAHLKGLRFNIVCVQFRSVRQVWPDYLNKGCGRFLRTKPSLFEVQ